MDESRPGEPFACLSGLVERAAADREWTTTARYWTGHIDLAVGGEAARVVVERGAVVRIDRDVEAPRRPARAEGGPGDVQAGASGPQTCDVSIHIPPETWAGMLAAIPRPFCQDWMSARRHGLRVGGSVETFYQYYPALRRLLELLRAAAVELQLPAGAHGGSR